VQAWLFERDGKFYESLVSYYPAINGLDVTVGDEGLTLHNLEEAFGRVLSEPVVRTASDAMQRTRYPTAS